MSEAVYLAVDELGAAMAAWRANVPGAVAHPELPAGIDDAASAAVLTAMAPWPAEHAVMATDREGAATRLEGATTATTTIVSTADDDAAVHIAAVEI